MTPLCRATDPVESFMAVDQAADRSEAIIARKKKDAFNVPIAPRSVLGASAKAQAKAAI